MTLWGWKTQVTVSEVMHNPESDDAKAHVLGSFEVSLHWWVESQARTALLHSKARSHTFPDVFQLLSGLLKLLSCRGSSGDGGGSGSEGAGVKEKGSVAEEASGLDASGREAGGSGRADRASELKPHDLQAPQRHAQDPPGPSDASAHAGPAAAAAAPSEAGEVQDAAAAADAASVNGAEGGGEVQESEEQGQTTAAAAGEEAGQGLAAVVVDEGEE